MAEMAAAVVALDLDPHTDGLRLPLHRARDLVVEGGPAATGVELRGGRVERRVAAAADVRSVLVELVVLAGERRLGPLVDDHVLFHAVQLVHARSPFRRSRTAPPPRRAAR